MELEFRKRRFILTICLIAGFFIAGIQIGYLFGLKNGEKQGFDKCIDNIKDRIKDRT